MSSVDLSKLIARKRFLVPVESSQLIQLVANQLEGFDQQLREMDTPSRRAFLDRMDKYKKWSAVQTMARSATFTIDYGYHWSMLRVMEEGYENDNLLLKVDENLSEYKKNRLRHSGELLLRTTDNMPVDLHYVVEVEGSQGCLCNATCHPSLYEKINKGLAKECDDAKMQDARMSCEEFLVDVFVGGLGGKEIPEERKAVCWELLTNDLDYHHITERIDQMLENATAEVLMMGYVGTHCLPELRELKDKNVTIQAVTHRPKEMKAPVPNDVLRGFSNLVEVVGKTNISINPELHGRALIVDNKALIGSMDLNAHSLSGEHTEFAVYTEDVDTVRRMRSYFKKIFAPLG